MDGAILGFMGSLAASDISLFVDIPSAIFVTSGQGTALERTSNIPARDKRPQASLRTL